MESAFNECFPSMWTSEWPYDDTRTYRKALISQEAGQSWRLGSATNVSCYLRQVLEPIKSAEWEENNDCFWLPYRYVMRINETVCAQRHSFLWRQGLVFFSAVCSLFKIPVKDLAWYFHGISQRNKVCFTDEVSKQVLQAASFRLWACAKLCYHLKQLWKHIFPPLPKWALNQLKLRFLWMLVSYCGSKNSGFYLTEVPFVASKRAAIRMLVCQVPNTSHQEKWPWIHVPWERSAL